MILGIGIDLVEMERIRRIVAHYGDRFLNRIFTHLEVQFAVSRADPVIHLAALFAAKEAASKALGTGIRGISWKEIEVRHKESGKPYLVFHGRARKRFETMGGVRSYLSISHEKTHTIAIVIIEGEGI